MSDLIYGIDLNILHFIENLKNPVLDFLMPLLTSLGNGGIIWIIAAIAFLCFNKTRKCGYALAIALILVLISGNIILKPLIARPRPFILDSSINLLIAPPTDFSFPSGHTYSSVAGAYAIYHYDRKFGIAAWILAGILAFSRLYLMVHFPTDILGGIILGVLCGYIAVKITDSAFCKPIIKRS